MLKELLNPDVKRLLIEVPLAPVQGNRFQPTGFADIGAGTFELPDGTRMLLVESAQSVANRLEATVLDSNGELREIFKGLPYIKVKMTGGADISTNSLQEAHRINSPFIINDEAFKKSFVEKADYARGKPLNWKKIAQAVCHFDPNSLLHGVFLANLEDGRIKIPRSISGFIEARNVREVVTGGVKNNHFDPSGKLRVEGYDKDVYGNVPFQRVEFSAESITAFFNLDIGALRGYGLREPLIELLTALGLWKIQRFLDSGLRLRTACDLKMVGAPLMTEPKGLSIPPLSELEKILPALIAACQADFASPRVTEITAKVNWKTAAGEEEAELSENTAEE